MMRALAWAAPYINMALKPVGLILWIDYDVDTDAQGIPVSMRPVSASIGVRPASL